MPPLVVPSPAVLDHSFPRTEEELRDAAAALGGLVAAAGEERLQILITPALREFAENFDWVANPQSLLAHIHALHAQWLLRPTRLAVEIDLSQAPTASPHPLPCGLTPGGLTDFWTDEIGRLRDRHDDRLGGARPGCAAVACTEAGADGSDPCGTDREASPPALRTVGPRDVQGMEDAYEYAARTVPVGARISYGAAKANVHLLEGRVQKQRGGSHTSVQFTGGRTWVLDANDDPVPDSYVAELKPITNLPLPVIRSVLYYGEKPSKICRLA